MKLKENNRGINIKRRKNTGEKIICLNANQLHSHGFDIKFCTCKNNDITPICDWDLIEKKHRHEENPKEMKHNNKLHMHY